MTFIHTPHSSNLAVYIDVHRGTTKRRLRRHSLASSVGSGSASITSGLTPGTTRATATFSGSLPRSNYFERSKLDEALLVTLEDVKGHI